MELRPYQNDALARSRNALVDGVHRQLMVLATGLGKTVVLSNLRSHHHFTKKILVLVHREELAAQNAEKLRHWNPSLRVGVEMGMSCAAPMDTIVVASVPTLGRQGSNRIKRFHPDEYDAVVTDETHHLLAPQWKRVHEHFGLLTPDTKGILSLGLTATPNRSDGQGLKAHYDMIVFDMGIVAGIESGYLAQLRGLKIETKTDLDAVPSSKGELVQTALAETVNTPERNGIIVREWYKNAKGRKTLGFCVNVQHALDLAAAFKAYGVSAEAVWGEDPDRRQKFADFKSGKIMVLTNCDVATEGFDEPTITCIIDAAPTKSSLRFTQKIGRGTRICDGKEDCLILDVADNTSKHSLMTLSSLLGMPAKMNMEGKTYREAKEKLDRIAQDFPTANLQDILSLSKLDSIAKSIEMFKVNYPPEVGKISELAWRKSDEGYTIAVSRSVVTVEKNILDEWWVRGSIGDKKIEVNAQNLVGAMNVADNFILSSGGCKNLLARDSHWRDNQPSEKQLALAQKIRLAIPLGATRGMVSAALDQHFASRR